MTDRLVDWWKLRSRREQWLLAVMCAMLAGVMLWFGIIRPIDNALSGARDRHADAEMRFARVEGQVAAIHELERNPPPALGMPLDQAVAELAKEAGFTPDKVTPQGEGKVDVSIPSARPTAFFAWIAALEAKGIIVDRLSARVNTDPTLAVDATFAARGR